jgi:hypothetical protein
LATTEEIQQMGIDIFLPISVAGLSRVNLLNRVDTKFVFNSTALEDILKELSPNYYILDVNGQRCFHYESVYLDTESYTLYNHHHSGKPNRIKVRYREYTSSGDVFFEVKKKSKGYRTDKHRIKLDNARFVLQEEELDLVALLGFAGLTLEEKIRIGYDRITLVAKDSDERVTIDLNLTFKNNGQEMPLTALAIAELKQEKFTRTSPFVTLMRNKGLSAAKISKFALAVALTEPGVKKNGMKKTIKKVAHILNK